VRIAILHTRDAAGPPEDPVLQQVEHALLEAAHETVRVGVHDDVLPVIGTLTDFAPDLVFNFAESFDGKSALESNIAALLNLLGLHYTGSSPAGLIMAGDKSLTKKVLGFHGIRTPQFATLYRGAIDWVGDIAFPLIVKPPQEDASLGVTSASVVHDLRELLNRIESVQDEFGQPALVEEFIDGREFYVGVIGNSTPRALPVVEMDFTGFPEDRPRIASFDAKWGVDGSGAGDEFRGTRSILARDLDPELVSRMQNLAIETFQALRLRDYARIDIRVSDKNEIFVIEVNPNCYLEASAEFAMAAAAADMSHAALIHSIIDLAVARYHR
jgi:D-alanine-D-alanine ligase